VRPNKDEYYLTLAAAASLRGTCARRKVGCVLVSDDDRIMATGYNGPARGQPHCIDYPCPGAHEPSGSGLDVCEAVHAEANALAYCPDIYRISTCYVTDSPCVSCVKMLMNTSCTRIVFLREYSHNARSKLLWLGAERTSQSWVHVPLVSALALMKSWDIDLTTSRQVNS
jgi:dCMP deaminase